MKIASQKYGPRDFSHGQIQEMLITLGNMGFSPAMADFIANAKSGKAREFVGLFSATNTKSCRSVADWLCYWQLIYRGFFKYNLDLSGLLVPQHREGFNRMLVMAEPAISQLLFDKSKEYFLCWKTCDSSIDEVVKEHERDPRNGAYAIWVEDTQEPNEKLKNISAIQMREMDLKTETLPERLLQGLVYYMETGQHLDVVNATCCTGSRYSVGLVPCVHWHGYFGEMRVPWASSSNAGDHLRSREVVS